MSGTATRADGTARDQAAPERSPILPGATLGVMGGGQLGRMFVHAAQKLGYFTAVLDPDPHSPAGQVSHHHLQTNYTDHRGLAELARLSAAITTEFENVPAQALEQLARLRPVAPDAACVAKPKPAAGTPGKTAAGIELVGANAVQEDPQAALVSSYRRKLSMMLN